MGPGWGSGWTATRYRKDLDFLASSKARKNKGAFLEVKRAQWIGDVFGEKRIHGDNDQSLTFNSLVTLKPDFWNGLALNAQSKIIKDLKEVTLEALGEELGESNKATIAQQVIASPVDPKEQKIARAENGSISIPSVAYSNPTGSTREVLSMKSFAGGMQIFLPRFAPEGLTVMRGGTWKGEAGACASGSRMLSGGYGRYENWGLRAAMTPPSGQETSQGTDARLG